MSLMRRTREEEQAEWLLVDLREREPEPRFPLLIEQFQEKNVFVVRAEVPGIDPERDVDITVRDHLVHLEARRHEEVERGERSAFTSDFHYGVYARSVPLPSGAIEDHVRATHDNGLLEIRIPIDPERAGVRHVPIARRSEGRTLRRSSN